MYNISEGNNMIKEIYDEKLKIESADYLQEKLSNNLPQGTEITNNNDKSFLIKTTENISNGLFSEYTYFNNSIKSFINTSIPLEYLYNILSLGNNLYLLKF